MKLRRMKRGAELPVQSRSVQLHGESSGARDVHAAVAADPFRATRSRARSRALRLKQRLRRCQMSLNQIQLGRPTVSENA